MRLSVWCAISLLLLSGGAVAQSNHIIDLPLTGQLENPPEEAKFPDGTVLSNTRFFESPKSSLSVGRTELDGSALPKEVIDYTDMVFVVGGSGTAVDSHGQTRLVMAGDLILLAPAASPFKATTSTTTSISLPRSRVKKTPVRTVTWRLATWIRKCCRLTISRESMVCCGTPTTKVRAGY